jgi:hypothetical protein
MRVLAADLIIYLSRDDWAGQGIAECSFVLVLVTVVVIGLIVGWPQLFQLLTLDAPLSPTDQISK